jgi:cell division protein FtsL
MERIHDADMYMNKALDKKKQIDEAAKSISEREARTSDLASEVEAIVERANRILEEAKADETNLTALETALE